MRPWLAWGLVGLCSQGLPEALSGCSALHGVAMTLLGTSSGGTPLLPRVFPRRCLGRALSASWACWPWWSGLPEASRRLSRLPWCVHDSPESFLWRFSLAPESFPRRSLGRTFAPVGRVGFVCTVCLRFLSGPSSFHGGSMDRLGVSFGGSLFLPRVSPRRGL